MALGSWVVESVIRYSSNGVAVMERDAAAANTLAVREAQLTGQLSTQEAAWLRLRRSQDEAAASRQRMIAGASAMVAIAGAAFIGVAVDHAAKLQQILLSIRNETGATSDQIKSITADLYNIGNQSGMSVEDAGEIWRSVSRMTAGQLSIEQMRRVAPLVADFASMVHFNRPDIDVNAAALTGLQTAHLFRAYTVTALNPLLDKVYRLSGLMGESPDQALRQMSYYEPMFKGLGIKDDQSLAMMALLDRAGFRNKVGTNVRAMVLEALGPLQLTSHAQSGKISILEQMGIFRDGKFAFNTPTGGMDFVGMLKQLAHWEHVQRLAGMKQTDLDKELFSVFGRQGGTIATLMSDPTMVRFLGSIDKYLNDPQVGLHAGIKNRDSSAVFAWNRAVGNFSSALTALGSSVLPEATGALNAFAHGMNVVSHFMFEHQGTAKALMGVLTLVTGAATIRALGAVSTGLLRFIGLLGGTGAAGAAEAGTVAGAAGTAAFALSRFNIALLAVVSIIGEIYDIKGMLDRKARGERVTQADYDDGILSPAGYGENTPGSSTYIGVRGRLGPTHGWTPQGQLENRLRGGNTTTIHNMTINVQGADAIDQLENALNDPRSALYQSTQTHKNIPLGTSVKPR